MESFKPFNTPRWASVYIALGSLLAAASVILAAIAAHGTSVSGSSSGMVQNALHLMQFHALGLILVGILGEFRPSEKRLQLAGALFILGTLLFSVNILVRAWADLQTFKALVPWGGTSFILGWLALSLAYVRKVRPAQVTESGDQTH